MRMIVRFTIFCSVALILVNVNSSQVHGQCDPTMTGSGGTTSRNSTASVAASPVVSVAPVPVPAAAVAPANFYSSATYNRSAMLYQQMQSLSMQQAMMARQMMAAQQAAAAQMRQAYAAQAAEVAAEESRSQDRIDRLRLQNAERALTAGANAERVGRRNTAITNYRRVLRASPGSDAARKAQESIARLENR